MLRHVFHSYVLHTLLCLTLLLNVTPLQAATTPVFVNLGVTHNPNKTLYAPDEPLDLRGLVVSKIYSDGSSKRVYGLTNANANATSFDSRTPGETNSIAWLVNHEPGDPA